VHLRLNDTLPRLGLCALGYLAACLAGAGAVALKNRGISDAEMDSMSGMFAFGDALTFVTVGAAVAIVPTIGLFKLIGSRERFWSVYEKLSIFGAATAVLSALLLLLPMLASHPTLAGFQALAFFRLANAPLWLLGNMPGVFLRQGRSRKLFIIANLLELASVGSFMVSVLLRV
jgi:hypothetical protein